MKLYRVYQAIPMNCLIYVPSNFQTYMIFVVRIPKKSSVVKIIAIANDNRS